jgi:hypothetical protein
MGMLAIAILLFQGLTRETNARKQIPSWRCQYIMLHAAVLRGSYTPSALLGKIG